MLREEKQSFYYLSNWKIALNLHRIALSHVYKAIFNFKVNFKSNFKVQYTFYADVLKCLNTVVHCKYGA